MHWIDVVDPMFIGEQGYAVCVRGGSSTAFSCTPERPGRQAYLYLQMWKYRIPNLQKWG